MDELKREFNEVVQNLRTLSEEYERGSKAAAKAIAVQLRVLLHDSKQNISLLTMFGRKRILFDSTPNLLAGTDKTPQLPLIRFQSRGVIAPEGATISDAEYVPVYWGFPGFGDALNMFIPWSIPPWQQLPFDQWWDQRVLLIDSQTSLTRHDIILGVADQQGGAHSDPSIEEKHAIVMRQQALRFSVSLGGQSASPEHGPQYACVRQICYEVQRTLGACRG
ncbi:MAG: hypothetical protein HY232_17050 [Acidobacteria bacterium]|nr:hypothetical protein [Acidobacteriota bacterium]